MTIFSELFDDIERGAGERIIRWTDGVVEEILTGRRVLTAVSHPLGFLCLPVHRYRDEGVCIHLWGRRWGQESPTTSPTHCHSWALSSWILAGELRNQILRATNDDNSPTHRVFEVFSSADGDEIRPTHRLVRIEVDTDTTYRAGESYRLPAGLFHQTIVPDDAELVATLALGRDVVGAVDLSLGGIGTPGHRVHRKLCDAEVAVEAAEALRRSPAALRPWSPAR